MSTSQHKDLFDDSNEDLTTCIRNSADNRGFIGVRHPPQSGWLDEWGRLKGGHLLSLGVALKRACINSSKLSVLSIRGFLLADVLADLLEFKADCGHCVAAGPEMLARKIPLLATQPGNGDRALPLQKPDHRRYRVLGGNRDTHVHMVRHQMPFENLALLLLGQRMENLPQMTARLPEYHFAPSLGHEHNMVLAVPFGMG